MFGRPYVGCKVLASSICMDKVYTKIILEKAGILQAKSEYVKKLKDKYIYIDKEMNEKEYDIEGIIDIIEKNLNYPMFVKPSNSGSSVGVNKAGNREELEKAINYAGEFDKKILIEQGIIRKRNRNSSTRKRRNNSAEKCGEIKAADEFYSFDAKYKNTASKTIIPAKITDSQKEEIRTIAKKAFKAVDGNRTFENRLFFRG